MTMKDVARPAANATGPSLCSATAVPNTTGVRGNTHGDRIENSPARNANGRVVSPIGVSQGLPQKRLDHLSFSRADRSLHLILVAINDERGDMMCFDLLKFFLVRVEIGFEDRHILEVRLFDKLGDDSF